MACSIFAFRSSAKSSVIQSSVSNNKQDTVQTEQDIPQQLEGGMNWGERNFQFHQNKSEQLRKELERQGISHIGNIPKWLPKQVAEEQQHFCTTGLESPTEGR